MNGYALEDGDERAGDGEAEYKVVAPEEDAAELHDGEDSVLEEDTAVASLLDMWLLEPVGSSGVVAFHVWWGGEERGEWAYMENLTDNMARV